MRRRIRILITSFWLQAIVLIAVGIAIRTAYLTIKFTPVVPDSISYVWQAMGIVANKPAIKEIINTVRPPVYPLFLTHFVKNYIPNIQVNPTYSLLLFVYDYVFRIQTVSGIISGILFFWIVRQLVSKPLAFISAVIYVVNLIVIPWERYMLTEAFAMQLVIWVLFFIVLYRKKYQAGYIICLTITLLLLAFLRSTTIVLIPVVFGGLLLTQKRKAVLPCVFGLIVCSFFIFGYIWLNGQLHGYQTFQFSGSVNIFGRMILRNYPIPNLPPENPIPAILRRFDDQKIIKNPFYVLPEMHGQFYTNGQSMAEVDEYNRASFLLSWPRYIKDSTGDFLSLWKEVSAWILIPPYNPSWEKLTSPRVLFYYSQQAFVSLYSASVFLFYLFPFISALFICTKKKIGVIYGIVSCMIFSQFFSAVFFGYEEYGRLVASVTPLLLLSLTMVLSEGIKSIQPFFVGLRRRLFLRIRTDK